MYLNLGFHCAQHLLLLSLPGSGFLTNILNCTRHHESLLRRITTFSVEDLSKAGLS